MARLALSREQHRDRRDVEDPRHEHIEEGTVGKTLKKFKGTAWDQSPFFKKLYEEEYGQLGGEPYGCLVGDYYFDHSGPTSICSADGPDLRRGACAVHLAAPHPAVMRMDSWQELGQPARSDEDLSRRPEYAAWRSLRESEDSRYIGLADAAFPRAPAVRRQRPIRSKNSISRKTPPARTSSKYAWANAAYAMAVNINRSFKMYGWCSRIRGIESGGAVEDLPVHTFPTDDGGVDMKCPTEIAISDRREAELAKNGFMPLVHKKNTDFAAFIGAQSLQKPAEYEDPDATANANLAARLPYLFASCRFAHYLKCIVRDKIGAFKERDDMQRWLQNWIIQYVDGDPAHSTRRDQGAHAAGRSRGRG